MRVQTKRRRHLIVALSDAEENVLGTRTAAIREQVALNGNGNAGSNGKEVKSQATRVAELILV